jgi:hypothetical protein
MKKRTLIFTATLSKYFLEILLIFLMFGCEKVNPQSGFNQANDWIQMKLYIKYDDPDGVTELFRYEYSYDSKGREIGTKTSSKGILLNQTRDYQYNDRNVTYWTDYPGSSLSVKTQQTYYDNNWIQLTQFIQYDADGVTERFRQEISYDAEGREVGYKCFRNGILSDQGRDYQYNGRIVTYWYDNYSGGSSQSQKIQKTYSDKNWIQMEQFIQYAADGVTEKNRHDYSYAADGREMGYKYYFNGKLEVQTRDYQYNGREVTYWSDNYFEGNMKYSTKNLKVYKA